jgi:ADP-ribosylarginine hydrolase
MSDKIEKYQASIYLAGIGDKIGFGNGKREKNYLDEIITTDNPNWKLIGEGVSSILIFRFISEGGITGIDLNTLEFSDDTVMHLDTIKGLNYNYKDRDDLYNEICKYYLESFKNMEYARDVLLAGRQTLESIKNISSGVNWRNFSYNKSAGGNGGLMRTMCIGLAFYQSNSLLKLIESAIMISSITHPNCISFIGSIISALFTSYALRDMSPETWIFELKTLLESDIIDNIIEKIKPSYIEFFIEDKKLFLYKLLTYIETSFEDYNYLISDNNPRSIYPWKRMLYYYENFSSNKKILFPGAGADDCIIIAYDCIMMAKDNYEKLIYVSMMNIGDTDTIGTLCSAWYGALYGFNKVPINLIDDEFNNIAKIYGSELYIKYYDKLIAEY